MATAIVENTPLSVFITGATGALGREVTRQLRAAGHRVTGATNGYENAALVRADGGIPAYPDLLRAGEIRSVLQAAKADVILNLAPQLAHHLPHHPAQWNARLMEEGVAELLEAAQAANVKFVVHTSYAFVEADPGEDDELDRFEQLVKRGENRVLKGAVPGCVLRMGFVYGAQSPELLKVRDLLMKGRRVDSGPDDSRVCWINAPDAARAVIAAMLARPAGELLTIVEDEAVSPAAFLRYFAQSQGLTPPGRAPRYARWAQPGKAQVAVMSLSPRATNAEAKAKLGWQPRFPTYRQGIDDVLLSWRTSANTPAVVSVEA